MLFLVAAVMLNHHAAKFDGHRQCDSGDKMFLVVKE